MLFTTTAAAELISGAILHDDHPSEELGRDTARLVKVEPVSSAATKNSRPRAM
jgi:hypothetical protein